MNIELIDRLLGKNIPTVEELEKKYPRRPEGQIVTRFAPSPTGKIHIGNIYGAIIPEKFAHQNGGVFILRLEDTDTKREVEGADQLIVNALRYSGIINDEGLQSDGSEKGDYGPYVQSKRALFYKVFIKKLLLEDKAYPCFMSPDELDKMREEQTKLGIRPGCYGVWAKNRKLAEQEINERLDRGEKFVIRFKSHGNFENKIVHDDIVRGKRQLPENDTDIVILKADGLPTYHFAHVVDDYLMGTTHVTRGDEWFISTPIHLQLFQSLGITPPKYIHFSAIQKNDEGSKRKLSKRKDPEATFSYYIEKGYPKEVIMEYLLNLISSGFEDFKKQNPTKSYKDYDIDIKKLNPSGALLDFKKLDSISKDFIATLSAEELYDKLYDWAVEFDSNLAKLMEEKKDYFISIFEIERKNTDRVRKDYSKFSTIWDEIAYFFNLEENHDSSNKDIIEQFKNVYDENDTKEEWFAKMKDLAVKNGYSTNSKEFDAAIHKGTISDFIAIFRNLLTGKKNSPDLYSIMKVLGKNEVFKRLF